MKGFPLVLIGIGGLGTIGTTTYSIVSEINKRTKRNLVSEEKLEENLEKNFEGLFEEVKQEMIAFSNGNPTAERFDDPEKSEFTLKKLQEFSIGFLTENNSYLSKEQLIKLIDKNNKNEVEKICLEIENFIEKIKGIDNKNSILKSEYEKRFNFSLTDK